MDDIEILTPRWALPLLEPKRYKGAKGGRGSGKSHFFAELAIEIMIADIDAQFVCIREIQKSLKFSARKLVISKIMKMNASHLFDITETEIRRIGGTGIMIFQGMQDHTADSIKSLEGFNYAWVEEAQSISAHSMELLLPTIRAENSEIWFSWNPRLETDPVEKIFKEEDKNSICVFVNYKQNPFITQTTLDEAERHLRTNPDTFGNVWLGEYIKRSEALIFKDKYRVAELDTFGWQNSYIGMDFGFSQDPNAVVKVWIKDTILYIEKEAYGIETEINELYYLIEKVDQNAKNKVIRCDSARPETISYLRNNGFPFCEPVKKGKGSVEDGIQFMRSFDIVIHPSCTNIINEFANYSYKVDKLSGDITPIIIDAYNHGIDACFSGDTQVIVNDMLMNFEDIPIKGKIRGFNGENVSYTNGGLVRCDKLWSVKLENGIIIKCTADHKFLTSSGEWINAVDLTGETLCEFVLFQNMSKNLTKRDIINIKGRDIFQKELIGFIAKCGNFIMEKSHKAFTFIIKIRILQIIILKISKCYQDQNIYQNIALNFTKIIRILQEIKSKKIKISVENGTAVKMEENGTSGIMKKIRNFCIKEKIRSVNLAKKYFMGLKGMQTYFAQMRVSQDGEEIQALMMSKEDVSFAVKNLKQTNTQRQLHVVEVVQIDQEIYPTYCVTVPNNECFSLANGIVVSNCRYALEPLTRNGIDVWSNII